MVNSGENRASVLDELSPVQDGSTGLGIIPDGVNDSYDGEKTVKKSSSDIFDIFDTMSHNSECKMSSDTNLTQEKNSRPVKEGEQLLFPDYDWPEPLNGLLMHCDTKVQRGALLLAGITIMGGMFGHRLYYHLRYRYLFPNLQTYIADSSFWDREALSFLRQMYGWIENDFQYDNSREYSHYLESMRLYNKELGKGKPVPLIKPLRPLVHKFLLSGAQRGLGIKEGIIHHLGRGFICEMEAEPLAHAVAEDYWHWQDAMRRCFDNERLSIPSRVEGKVDEARCAAMSVLLSGSYETLQALIPRVSNCLFSQQVFYCMQSDKGCYYSYISSADRGDKNKAFRGMYDAIRKIYKKVVQEKLNLELCLYPDQYDKIRTVFSGLKRMARQMYEYTMDPVVDKLEINVMRIIMVVAALRRLCSDELTSLYSSSVWASLPYSDSLVLGYKLNVSDEDLDACLGLATPLFYHSVHVAETMSDEISKVKVKATREDILALMGKTFKQKEFFATAKQYGIPQSTSANWVRSRYKDIKCLGNGLIMKVDPKKK